MRASHPKDFQVRRGIDIGKGVCLLQNARRVLGELLVPLAQLSELDICDEAQRLTESFSRHEEEGGIRVGRVGFSQTLTSSS